MKSLMYAVIASVGAAASSSSVAGIVSPLWSELKAHTARVGDLSTAVDATDTTAPRVKRAIDGVKNTTECEIRLLAYEYALTLKPERASTTKMVDAFDALELSTMCQLPRPTPGRARCPV